MKRILTLSLAIVLLLTCICYAEGKIKVTQKNLYVIDGDDTGYFFARYENVGDESIGVGTGTMVAFTEDDEILLTEDYISSCPSYILLQPGESLYARTFIWDKALLDGPITDYKYSVEVYDYPKNVTRIPCEVTFDLNGPDTYKNDLFVTYTNTTDQALYGIYVVAALLDEEGNILFVESSSASNIALHPGSTATVKIGVPDDLMKHYKMHNLIPATADAMVFIPEE